MVPPDREPRARLRAALDGVEGWLWTREAWELHEAVRLHPSVDRPLTVVEIGSWRGRSAIALAMGLRSRGSDGRVHAIDPHAGADDGYRRFLSNVERAGLSDLVQAVRLTSHEARPRFPDGSVDVLFVDGAHDYETVRQDVDDWTSALAPGAVVAFNDPFWPGVRRALTESAAVVGSPLRRPRFVVNTLVFAHTPGSRWDPNDERALRRLRLLLGFGSRWSSTIVRVAHAPVLPYGVKFVINYVVGRGGLWCLERILLREHED